jgi:ubiquinone/menaquinone biosynthesis C-methylase UbiE
MVYLSEKDKARVVKRYLDRYAEHGIHVDTLKSGGAGKQFIRHSVHASMFDLEGKDILDVGCGIGMFYEYLKNSSIKIASYTGLDIIDPFIESNRIRFPEARFDKLDIFRAPLDAYKPDIVFMSQVFNNRYQETNNEEIIREAIRRFFAVARVGLAIDFLTSYVDYMEPELYYFSPEKILAFAKTLTRTVAIRHDYLPFEFTLFLYKRPTFDLEEINAQLVSG